MSKFISAAALGAVIFMSGVLPVRAFRGDLPIGPPSPPPAPECRARCDPPAPLTPPPANDGPCRGGRAC